MLGQVVRTLGVTTTGSQVTGELGGRGGQGLTPGRSGDNKQHGGYGWCPAGAARADPARADTQWSGSNHRGGPGRL